MSQSPEDQKRSSLFTVGSAIAVATVLGGFVAWISFRPVETAVPRADEARVPPAETALLADITSTVGLDFVHSPGKPGGYFFPEIMGAGAALFDFDLDGDLDIYLINGSLISQTSGGGTAGREHGGAALTNRLYRQESSGRFADVTEISGLGDRGYGMGVAVGDVNNDGYSDVYVTNYGPDRLYLNRGNGTFLDITEEAGIDNPSWGASACFVDYDRDGRLDLVVTNYVDYYPSTQCADARGREDYCGPQVFFGTADKLYRNETPPAENDGLPDARRRPTVRFADVSLTSGIARQRGPGLGVMCADFNGDRWPDIYVANDGTANFLWINQHDGTFRDEAILRGVAYDAQGRPQAGMGIAWGDVDANGRFDLFVTHLSGETNTLYLSDPAGFRDAGPAAGLAGPSFPYTGFGTAMADLDHDGDLDVAAVNGRVKRPAAAAPGDSARSDQPLSDETFWRNYAEPNQIFLNHGDGRFREFSSRDDPFISTTEVSRGLAMGDIDNDGDLDFLVSNAGGRARLYRNDAPKDGHWLQVRAVEPTAGGRDSYGAVVTVTAGERQWRRMVNAGSSYLSSSDPRVHFGLGSVTAVDAIEVLWPDGTAEIFAGGPVDRLRILRHGEGQSP